MEHIVFFPAHDGSPAFRRVANRDDAVRLVEHLRNVENVSEVSLHSLAEVPLTFKTWYHVEVEPVPSVAVTELPVEVPEQPVAVLASAGDHAAESNGPSSLGFFAS